MALVSFFMAVNDCFNITGKGTVIPGVVTNGTVKTVDVLIISSSNKNITVVEISKFKKTIDPAAVSDDISILISGVEYSEIERGNVVYTSSHMKVMLNLLLTSQCILKMKEVGILQFLVKPISNSIYVHLAMVKQQTIQLMLREWYYY